MRRARKQFPSRKNAKNTTTLAAALALAVVAFAQTNDEELVMQLANPVASLISMPFQSNFDFRMGALDMGTQYRLNFQPVIPVSLTKDWNLIIHTIVPYVSQKDVFTGPLPSFPGLPANILNQFPAGQRDALDRAAEKAFNKAARERPVDVHQDGLSDIVQSFFFSPKAPVGGWILGFGPVLLYHTATDDLLGTEKWAAGPTALALRQSGGTYACLFNQRGLMAGMSLPGSKITRIRPQR